MGLGKKMLSAWLGTNKKKPKTTTVIHEPVPHVNTALENIDGYSIRYHYEDVNIFTVGDSIPNGINIGDRVVFVQEKDNEYDENAVLLLVVPQKKRLGYLRRGKLQDMANDYLSRGDKISARVSLIYKDPFPSVYIDMVFYVKVHKKK